jgi:hypothetical protein
MVEAFTRVERVQNMYDLLVDVVHTFAVGEDQRIILNLGNCPDFTEIGDWENSLVSAAR